MAPTTRELRDTIREVLKEEISDKLDKLEAKVDELAGLKQLLTDHSQRMDDFETTLEFTSKQIKEINDKTIPDLEKKFMDIATKISLNTLDLDTHRRKWSLILNGVNGDAGESEQQTRTKVRQFATHQLKITGADSQIFTACHRLSQKDQAGIIVCFSDLSHRNQWLHNAKNLKNSGTNISISPDLHPCLRQLKSNIMKIRKELPLEQKQNSQVQYLPRWPYICLKVRGQRTINPSITKETIVQSYLEKNA